MAKLGNKPVSLLTEGRRASASTLLQQTEAPLENHQTQPGNKPHNYSNQLNYGKRYQQNISQKEIQKNGRTSVTIVFQ